MGYACYMRRHRNGVWSDEDWLRFTTLDEFWDWVVSKLRSKTKLYLFCHNTSFDLPVLNVFKSLPVRGFTLRSAIIDAPPTILRFHSSGKSIVILDTLNIWRMPLSYLGEKIGLGKLAMPDNNDLSIEWERYAKRDVEIIKAACLGWFDYLEKNDMGGFAPTLAGQSMRVYRHRYMKQKIFIDDNERSLKLTRSGYYGGRVECFRIGKYKQRLRQLDFNSMYPDVMQSEEYPFKLISHTKYATIDDLHRWLQRYCITAAVRLRTDKPFAPLRAKHKLIFPVGEFDCILSSPEIRYALDHQGIVEVHEIAVYERAPLFREFVDDMYANKERAKRAGEKVEEFNWKKLTNSFYGKWGQSGGKWTEDFNLDDLSFKVWDEYDMETGRVIHHRQLGGLQQSRTLEGESRDSFPAIAAHVTAYARMKLWNAIELAGIDNVFYCDTDCVYVNDTGYDRLAHLIDDYRLGALKLSGEYNDSEIWGAKDYSFGHTSKTKGVRKNAVWLSPTKIEQNQWSGLRGLIQLGQADRPYIRTIQKNLKRLYDKGVVQANGKVIPHSLPSPELPLLSPER